MSKQNQLGAPRLNTSGDMTTPQFIVANLRDHREHLLSLNLAFFSWVFAEIDEFFGIRCADVLGMEAPAYADSFLDKVCDRTPPEGIFYLVWHRGQFAAMGGLRSLSTDIAEVKRVYVRPDCRGAKLGELLLDRLLADAAQFGYQRVFLESGPFMKSAHRIYEAAGFVDRPPYLGAEVPEAFHERWRFMERPLAQLGEA